METRFVKILLFLLCMVENSAMAYHFIYFENGVNFYFNIINNSELELSYGRVKYSGDIVIPDVVMTYTVTGIGDETFKDCANLTSVTIPNTVTTIGRSAFEGCI